MKQLPDVPAFVIEFVQRLFKKSPKFFRVLNAITGWATVIAGGIPVVVWACNFFGVHIPSEYAAYGDVAIAKLAGVAWITGKLAIDRSTASTAEVKQLPFTVKKELQQEIKTETLINNTLK